MDIGQVFTFEGAEFAVKRVIFPGGTDSEGRVYSEGRVDASRFVGEGVERHIQRGRPKMFDYASVATILGEPTTPATVECDLAEEDKTNLDNWRGERTDPEKVRQFMEKFKHNEDAVSVEGADW